MRKSNAVILIAAILMGGLAALLARDWLYEASAKMEQEARALAAQEAQTRAAQEARSKPTAEVTRTIVVASVPLLFGTKITEDKVEEIRWSAEQLPIGAFSTKQELMKDGPRVALGAIQKDEPVLRFKINAPGQRGGSLSSLLDEGMRAVSIPIDNSGGVAGRSSPTIMSMWCWCGVKVPAMAGAIPTSFFRTSRFWPSIRRWDSRSSRPQIMSR